MQDSLRAGLDELYRTFDISYIDSDPVRILRRFADPRDQEIMAVVASSLAFGQVSQINRAVEMALFLMNGRPRDFVDDMDPSRELKRWKGFYYRMVRPSDILRLIYALQDILGRHDRLAKWIANHYDPQDSHLGLTWARCVEEIKSRDREIWRWKRSGGIGFRHLLPDPSKKSASKRAHLLLRWMVRRDGIDLGLWSGLPCSKLLIPVDTHVQRIAFNIGLTNRRDASLATAIEITSRLKELDPDDPVKYDFALCRLGILKLCPRRRDPHKCQKCLIYDLCRL